jgi:hypothetical protein
MDPGMLIGTPGALSGVVIGSLLSERSQRRLLRATQDAASDQIKREACVQFLAAHRSFRRHLQTEDVEVRMIPVLNTDQVTPVVSNSSKQWECHEQARAALHIVISDEGLISLSDDMHRSLYSLMRARADHPPGGIPNEFISEARAIENRFAELARRIAGPPEPKRDRPHRQTRNP